MVHLAALAFVLMSTTAGGRVKNKGENDQGQEKEGERRKN